MELNIASLVCVIKLLIVWLLHIYDNAERAKLEKNMRIYLLIIWNYIKVSKKGKIEDVT